MKTSSCSSDRENLCKYLSRKVLPYSTHFIGFLFLLNDLWDDRVVIFLWHVQSTIRALISPFTHFPQIYDTQSRIVSDVHGVGCGIYDRSHSRDMEQVGAREWMRVRSNLLPVVHGRSHHARLLAGVAVHALRILSNLARGLEASQAASNDGTAGRNVRLEIRSSKLTRH